MAQETQPTTNRRIDQLIVEANWQIEPKWALGQLKRYANELDLIDSGVSISELGYAERRANQRPAFYAINGQTVQRLRSEEDDEEEDPFYQEEDKDEPEVLGKVAVLKMTGVMQTQDSLSTRGVATLCEDIRNCNADPSIGAIVLKVESGGGMSLAGQMLQGAIKDSHLPVVVHADFMASAAVRGTLQADHIMAAGPGTEVGSIGSMISIDKWWANYYKKNYDDLYSRKARDKNREWREYLKGNKGPLVDSATKDDEIFMQEVIEHRPLRGDTGKTLRGGMFFAEEALERGLVDSIGTFNEAIIRATVLGEFNKNKNSKTMKKQLIQFLNTFFAWDLPENASQDEVMAKFAGLKPLEEQLDQAREEGRQEAESKFEARIQKLEERLQAENQTDTATETTETDETDQTTETAEEETVETASDDAEAAPEATNDTTAAPEAGNKEENAVLARFAALEAKMANLEKANSDLKAANDKLKRQAANDKIADEFKTNSNTPDSHQDKSTQASFESSIGFDYEFPNGTDSKEAK